MHRIGIALWVKMTGRLVNEISFGYEYLDFDGGEPSEYPSQALKLMSTILEPDNYPFYTSAISVWEVAKKVSIGKLTLSIPIRDWLVQASLESHL